MADNTSGYYGVRPPQKNQRFKQRSKPYQARLSRGGQRVNLGYFATVEEAALCVARFPDDKVEAWAQLILNDEVDGWC